MGGPGYKSRVTIWDGCTPATVIISFVFKFTVRCILNDTGYSVFASVLGRTSGKVWKACPPTATHGRA